MGRFLAWELKRKGTKSGDWAASAAEDGKDFDGITAVGDAPAMQTDHFPVFGDAGSPELLGVFGLTG
jgi:hypothetical protein